MSLQPKLKCRFKVGLCGLLNVASSKEKATSAWQGDLAILIPPQIAAVRTIYLGCGTSGVNQIAGPRRPEARDQQSLHADHEMVTQPGRHFFDQRRVQRCRVPGLTKEDLSASQFEITEDDPLGSGPSAAFGHRRETRIWRVGRWVHSGPSSRRSVKGPFLHKLHSHLVPIRVPAQRG